MSGTDLNHAFLDLALSMKNNTFHYSLRALYKGPLCTRMFSCVTLNGGMKSMAKQHIRHSQCFCQIRGVTFRDTGPLIFYTS